MKHLIYPLLLLTLAISCKKESNCPDGYTGDNCTEEIPPKSYLIKSISLTGWPLYDNAGVAWDFGSNVDLYVKVYKYDLNFNPVLLYTSPIHEDAQIGFTQNWPTSIEFLADEVLYVEVWDDDGGFSEDDEIGYCIGPYWEPGQGFPASKTVTDGEISMLFGVDYRF